MDATFFALVGLIIFLGILAYVKVPRDADRRAPTSAPDQIRNETRAGQEAARGSPAPCFAEYQRKPKRSATRDNLPS